MEVRGGRSKDDSKALIYSTVKKEDGTYENVQFLHKDKENSPIYFGEFFVIFWDLFLDFTVRLY